MDKREQLIDIMEEAAKGETKATLRARIAELEAEVERTKKWYLDAIEQRDKYARLWDEALSRTGAVKAALSGDTGELIDRMAAAIRDWGSHYDDGPWETLPEDRKAGWRGDAERALAVVKEYLTARRPSEQAVTEAMVEALRNIDAEAPAKEPRDDWTSTDLDEAFYEGKLRGFWEMAVYAREALTAALGAQTPPERAVTEAMVEAAAIAISGGRKDLWDGFDLFKRASFRTRAMHALRAAMEAGRHD